METTGIIRGYREYIGYRILGLYLDYGKSNKTT